MTQFLVIGYTVVRRKQDTEVWRTYVDADARDDAVLWAFAENHEIPTYYATCTLASSEEVIFNQPAGLAPVLERSFYE